VIAPPPTRPTRPRDLEALIKEARRRQRRRRLRLAAAAAATTLLAGASLYFFLDHSSGGGPSRSSAPPPLLVRPLTLSVHLLGFGTPLQTAIDSGACPQGRTQIAIVGSTGARIGTSHLCVLTIEKTDVPNYGVRRITQTVLETDSLPGGSIVSRQTQTISFARDQSHTTARFRGRILRGTGRFAHARGTIVGGGSGTDGKADWRVTFRIQ
jgi:hypothetical protein